MALLGIRAFAQSHELVARMGRAVAPSTVTRWAQDGKIVLVGHGRRAKVDVAASIARLDAMGVGQIRSDVSDRHAFEKGAPIPTHAPAQKNATAAQETRNAGATLDNTTAAEDRAFAEHVTADSAGKAKYKAIALHYENQGIKLGMALGRGQRFHRADVRDENAALGNALRASVERLIDQTAPRLAMLTRHMDRGELIRREIKKIKRLIDLEHTQALRRLRRNARNGGKDA